MRIIVGDLWEQYGEYIWRVIPTNLSVKNNGYAVMGRGVAKQAIIKFPNLPQIHGKSLREGKREVVAYDDMGLIAFPVKNEWHEKSNLEFIEKSTTELTQLGLVVNTVYLPLVGCGFGELEPLSVLTMLAKMLDDKYTLVLRDENATERWKSTLMPGARVDRTVKYAN